MQPVRRAGAVPAPPPWNPTAHRKLQPEDSASRGLWHLTAAEPDALMGRWMVSLLDSLATAMCSWCVACACCCRRGTYVAALAGTCARPP